MVEEHERVSAEGMLKRLEVTNEIVGYFAWVRSNGLVYYEKRDAEIRRNAMPESVKFRNECTIQEHPLNEVQWKLGLDELADAYPLIEREDNVQQTKEKIDVKNPQS